MTAPDARPLAVVTGASRGIGAAVAKALAPTHDLLLGGRDGAALEALAADLPGAQAWPGSYAASKFALRAFADALRAEEAAHGVRVTSVHPGRTDTDMQRAVVAHEGGEYDGSRFLRAESVARVVLLAVTAPSDADVTEVSIRPS